jgi:hypothetical protein
MRTRNGSAPEQVKTFRGREPTSTRGNDDLMKYPQTRRRLGVAAGLAALTAAVTACSGGTSVGGSSSQPAASGKVEGAIRLSYWGSGKRVELTNGVSNLFTKANPGVTVTPEYTDFASYWNKLNVQATSGNMACVVQMQGRQLNDYASKGLLIDLEPLVQAGKIDVSQIPKNVLDTGRGTDGKLYEIPYGAAYDAIMVNEALAKQAGVGTPAADWTWNDLQAYVKKAQASLPEGVKSINLGGGLPNYFIEYVQAQGQKLFEGNKAVFPQQTLVDFWKLWESFRKDGLTTTAQEKAAEAPQTEQSFIATGKVLADNKPGNQLGQAAADHRGPSVRERSWNGPVHLGLLDPQELHQPGDRCRVHQLLGQRSRSQHALLLEQRGGHEPEGTAGSDRRPQARRRDEAHAEPVQGHRGQEPADRPLPLGLPGQLRDGVHAVVPADQPERSERRGHRQDVHRQPQLRVGSCPVTMPSNQVRPLR